MKPFTTLEKVLLPAIIFMVVLICIDVFYPGSTMEFTAMALTGMAAFSHMPLCAFLGTTITGIAFILISYSRLLNFFTGILIPHPLGIYAETVGICYPNKESRRKVIRKNGKRIACLRWRGGTWV